MQMGVLFQAVPILLNGIEDVVGRSELDAVAHGRAK
jgi:hypothetical protein